MDIQWHILTSIKKKKKNKNKNCFKTHFLIGEPKKIESLSIIDSNKLNKIKELSKQKYRSTRFDINKDNIKMSWKLIGLIINMTKKRLRCYLSLKQLKQLYHTLIYPYINYAIISWGSASTSNLKKIQAKQNHIVRLIFFATLYGKHTESVLPLLNLLDLLSVENIFAFQLLNFCHQWHKKQLPDIFDQHSLCLSCSLVQCKIRIKGQFL